MVNKFLQAAVNGGLTLNIAADPNLLSIDDANIPAKLIPVAADKVVILDSAASFAVKDASVDDLLTNLADGQVLGTTGGNIDLHFSNTSGTLTVETGLLQAVDNFSASVAGGAADCSIDSAGLIAPDTCSREVKEHIRDASEIDIADLMALKARTYNRIGQTADEIGLIAEEVAETCPEIVVFKREDIEPLILPNGKKKRRFRMTNIPQTVNKSRLIVPLLWMVQSQAAEIAAMKARLDALEA